MENTCICCGVEIPEGRQICPACEKVDHPAHYNTGKYECIEVMRDTFGDKAVKDFCICNAFKYIWRSEKKNGSEDIKKARWYLDKLIEMEGGK